MAAELQQGAGRSGLLRNFSLTFSANIVSMLVSVLMVFFLSRGMGVERYGYWQLYLLYCSYTSFVHLGLADGFYLRHSGERATDLAAGLFSGLFRLACFLAACFCLLSALYYSAVQGRADILALTGLATLFSIPRVFIQFGWQALARFRENALIIVFERLLFLLGALAFAFLKGQSFHQLIAIDIGAKVVALFVAVYMGRDLVVQASLPWAQLKGEVKADILSGMSLMLATISSSLLIGLNQLVIKGQWGIQTYSRIALTLSLSNFLMIFINALALVLLPFIRGQEEERNRRLYMRSRRILILILVLGLNVYFPLRCFANFWLPRYSPGIVYMAILFPVCIFESKNQLLTNTFLKNYRRERDILKANLLSLALCGLLLWLGARVFANLFFVVLSLLVSIAFRSLISEYYLSRVSGDFQLGRNLLELLIAAAFVLSQYGLGGWMGALSYALLSLAYLLFERQLLQELLGLLLGRLRRRS